MDRTVSLQFMPDVKREVQDKIILIECKECKFYETCPVMKQLDKEIDQMLDEHMVGA